jgi:ribonuclease HI
MELEAIAEALDMTPPGAEVHLTTDSQYAYHVLVGDWTLTSNLDIIRRIHRLAEKRLVLPMWVPRNSEPEMQKADALSKRAAQACPEKEESCIRGS